MKIKHDPDSAAHLAAHPHATPRSSANHRRLRCCLLLSSLTTALSELSGAGEHTIDRASGMQEQASERPPSLPLLCCAERHTVPQRPISDSRPPFSPPASFLQEGSDREGRGQFTECHRQQRRATNTMRLRSEWFQQIGPASALRFNYYQ